MDSIDFCCPSCHQELEAPAELFGKIIPCPNCKKPLAIPTPPREPLDPPTQIPELAIPNSKLKDMVSPTQTASCKARVPTAIILAVGVLAVTCLCLGAGVIFLLHERGSDTTLVQQASGVQDKPTTAQAVPVAVRPASEPTLVQQTTGVQAKSTTAPAVYDAVQPASEPKVQKKGKVVVTVTWQYNKYVGTKSDTGAMVVLIPKNYNRKIKVSAVDLQTWAIGADKELLSQDGIFIEKVNGQGRAVFNRVPVGQYECAIQSHNTKAYERMAESTVSIMSYLFECDDLKNNKIYTTIINKFGTEDVTVDGDTEVEVSHDFGYTDV